MIGTLKSICAVLGLVVLVGAAGSCSQTANDSSQPSSSLPNPDEKPAQPGDSQEKLAAYGGKNFYSVPNPLPVGMHGTLIRFEKIEQSGNSDPDRDSTIYRIMYLSESLRGEPIAVTGVASVPTAQAPKDGRPLLTIAHGTTGIADECAPSRELTRLDMGLATSELGSEFLIAATDYEGLGTPGRHPYLVGESEGRSTMDAIVAAGELPDAEPGPRVAIMGYSQGGHGALWASQVAAEWTPQLQVMGTFSGAPASETDIIFSAAPFLPVPGFALILVAGFQAAYEEADPSLFLTDLGVSQLDEVDTGCSAEVIARLSGTNPADLVKPAGPESEPWKRLATENMAGTQKTNDAPTLIIHSQKDETVPIAFTELLLARMCANGQIVERRVLPEGGHGAAALPAYAQGLTWVKDRFADSPPTVASSC
ncbi:MAG: lipase family protein [Microthrixaceae bacterium]